MSGTSIGAINATVSNKIFDFSETTVRQLIQDGYTETKEQMKEIIARVRRELSST